MVLAGPGFGTTIADMTSNNHETRTLVTAVDNIGSLEDIAAAVSEYNLPDAVTRLPNGYFDLTNKYWPYDGIGEGTHLNGNWIDVQEYGGLVDYGSGEFFSFWQVGDLIYNPNASSENHYLILNTDFDINNVVSQFTVQDPYSVDTIILIPEPGTLMFIGTAVLALLIRRKSFNY